MKLYRREAFSAPAVEHGLVESLVLWEAPARGQRARTVPSRSPCSPRAFPAQPASEPLVPSERSIGRKLCLCLCGPGVTRPSPGTRNAALVHRLEQVPRVLLTAISHGQGQVPVQVPSFRFHSC